MIGHMHEDTDQMFSCISERLSKNNARTLFGADQGDWTYYSPTINASLLTFMYDVKQWLEGCIVSSLSGHTHHHQFKLTKGPDRKRGCLIKSGQQARNGLPRRG